MSEVTQYEGILTYVDAAGNETEMYPEVKTDKSLTVSGKPADAKAVGDKITEAMKNAGGKAINLTQEEYDNLSEEEKKNGIYVTPGGAELTAKNLAYDGSVTGLGNNVQDAVDNLQDAVREQNKKIYPNDVSIEFGKVTTSGTTRTITLQKEYTEMLHFEIGVMPGTCVFLPRDVTFVAPNKVTFMLYGVTTQVTQVTASYNHSYMFVGR